MVTEALAYAARGWAVIPLGSRGKLPLSEHGSRDATTGTTQIREWWGRWPDANVGIATGQPSGLLVVDLDGPAGVASWAELAARHDWPRAPVVRTGSGGYHIYTRCSHGAKNSAKRIGPGIDTRGDGGYVVAPPSIHPSGSPYVWARGGELQDAPQSLLERLRPPAPAAVNVPMPTFGTTAYGAAALRSMCDRVLAAGEGSRNQTLNIEAWAAGGLSVAGHLTRSDAEALIDVGCAAGLERRESEATFASGFEAGLRSPKGPPAAASDSSPRYRPPSYQKQRYAW